MFTEISYAKFPKIELDKLQNQVYNVKEQTFYMFDISGCLIRKYDNDTQQLQVVIAGI